MVTVVPLFST